MSKWIILTDMFVQNDLAEYSPFFLKIKFTSVFKVMSRSCQGCVYWILVTKKICFNMINKMKIIDICSFCLLQHIISSIEDFCGQENVF